MIKKVIVISLGGSLIVPKEVDYNFLEEFKKIIRKNYRGFRFIIVCGGGSIARKYISALEKEGKSIKEQSIAGIKATRMNAELLIQFFGDEANSSLPNSMKEVRNLFLKNKVVFCGALKYEENETTDGTAAKLANYFKSDLINMTNVKGLYTLNPKNKGAKFISGISWKDFEKKALKMKYRPGQHFILDQNAAVTIRKNKIKTYVIGRSIKNLGNLLNGRNFVGTIIEG